VNTETNLNYYCYYLQFLHTTSCIFPQIDGAIVLNFGFRKYVQGFFRVRQRISRASDLTRIFILLGLTRLG
jgi:hypothetical protein